VCEYGGGVHDKFYEADLPDHFIQKPKVIQTDITFEPSDIFLSHVSQCLQHSYCK